MSIKDLRHVHFSYSLLHFFNIHNVEFLFMLNINTDAFVLQTKRAIVLGFQYEQFKHIM